MEYNKEKYKAQLQKRKAFMLGVVLGCSSILTLKIADMIFGFLNLDVKTTDFLTGMVIGLASVFMIFSGFTFGKLERALRNEERLKAMWIKENDERSKAIEEKSFSTGFRITAIVLGFASMVAAFFSLEVFIGVFISLIIMLLVKIFSRIYYNKKL